MSWFNSETPGSISSQYIWTVNSEFLLLYKKVAYQLDIIALLVYIPEEGSKLKHNIIPMEM